MVQVRHISCIARAAEAMNESMQTADSLLRFVIVVFSFIMEVFFCVLCFILGGRAVFAYHLLHSGIVGKTFVGLFYCKIL